MQVYTANRVRLGAVVFGFAGVISPIAQIIANTTLGVVDGSDQAAAAQAATATNYQVWGGLMIAYSIAAIFGWLGFYLYFTQGRAEASAFWGTLITVLGALLVVPGWGVWSYAAPVAGQLYLQGNKDAMTVYAAINNSPSLLVAYASLPVLLVGLVLLSLAVWRDNSLPKVAMVMLVITSLLQGPLPLAVVIINAIFRAVAGLWLAYSIWQHTKSSPQLQATFATNQPLIN